MQVESYTLQDGVGVEQGKKVDYNEKVGNGIDTADDGMEGVQ